MEHVDFTLMGIIKQMGAVALAVSATLVLMSMWTLHVTIDRWLAFRTARNQSNKGLTKAYELFYEDKLTEASEVTRAYPRGHLAQVMGAALSSYLHDKERGAPADYEAVDRAIEKTRVLIIATLKRGMTSLATISATAPFVGLFGTVFGIINAFVGMAKTGSGGLGAVSAGIAEALFTTAFGLMVAIPAVWIYNYFNGRVEETQAEIDTVKADIMDQLIRRKDAKDGGKHQARAGA
jgi:biopolymer transport protein ExbB/biopolymer transport protein TolQ